MDKYEYKVKLEQIEKLAGKKDYVTAAKIADGIDWRKEKSVTILTMIADIYEMTDRLEDCYEILNMVYDRSTVSRRVVYRMAEIAAKMHNFEEAISLYKEFIRIASHDLNKYILKYQICRERGSSLEEQISILEEFKSHEYDEKWAYELACLYEEAGQIDRCIEECDELILWYSEGEYVVKAMELKQKYQELTAAQKEKYEHRFDYLENEIEETPHFETESVETEEPQYFETENVETEGTAVTETLTETVLDNTVLTEETQPVNQETAVVQEESDDTPKVSIINTEKYNTINLQEELAKGIQIFLNETEETQGIVTPDTQEFIPVKESVVVMTPEATAVTGEPVKVPEVTAVTEEPVKVPEVTAVTEEPVKVSEVTAVTEEPVKVPEVTAVTEEPVKVPEVTAVTEEPMKVPEVTAVTEELVKVPEVTAVTEEPVKVPEVTAETKEAVKIAVEETKKPAETEGITETAQLQSEILKYATVKQERRMEDYLQVEEDGQLSLIIGEENTLEKQITGQMTIEEILEAWEETKRQARVQIENAESGKQVVPFETGEITGILKDFIPKTPKDAVPVKEPESVVDDLPIDIDLEEALENALTETYKKPAETLETETLETETYKKPAETLETETYKKPAETLETETYKKPAELAETETDITDSAKILKKETVGQSTASMVDAIEQALAAQISSLETTGQHMTEEQEKIFAYFTSVKGMKKQLLTLLSEEHLYTGRSDSGEGNLIITGHPGNGKTTLAIDIVKALQKQRREKGGKLAKVTGDGMNKKNPAEVVKKLGGGALIIERAGSLKDSTIEELSAAMEGMTGGLLVILEDDSEEIQNLLRKNAEFAAKFTRSVDIPIFSNDELVAFGKSYAEEKEYYFDEMAVLALYDSIGVRQTADHVVNITEVKEFVDDAIAHAEKKSRGLFARLSKKRIDEYGNKLLLEEDFEY